jgi:hypothetical protein
VPDRRCDVHVSRHVRPKVVAGSVCAIGTLPRLVVVTELNEVALTLLSSASFIALQR